MGQKQPLPGHEPDWDDEDRRRISAHEQWFMRTLNADAIPTTKEIQAFLDEHQQLGEILADYYGRQASQALEEHLEQGSPPVPEPEDPMEDHAIFSFSLPERLPGNPEDHWVHRDDLGKFFFTVLALQALIELGVDMSNNDAVNTFFDRLEKMNETQFTAIRGDLSEVKEAVGKNSPNKDERTGLYKAYSNLDEKIDTTNAKVKQIGSHFKKAFWWGTGFAAALGFIGFKVM